MKNIRISKRLLSMLTAGVLMATPVMANTESNEENTSESEFTLVVQDRELTPMTMDEFYLGVKNAYEYLSKFIKYDDLQKDLQCLYYLTNRSYITEEDENELINSGIVYETNIKEDKYENFMFAYNVINVIADYNQSVIKDLNNPINLRKITYEGYDREIFNNYLIKVINDANYSILDAIVDYNNEVMESNPELMIEMDKICVKYDERFIEYLTKVVNNDDYDLLTAISDYSERVATETYDKLIDVSKLCYGDYDIKLVHDMHTNYFDAYKNGRFYNEDYEMIFKQLTTLNAYEQAGNADELSVGARWLAQNSIGGGVMQLLRDDMQEDFPRSELDKYFVKSELNKGQWILRDDISLDINCIKTELEFEVFNFGQLWHFVYDTVNNDIFKTFEKDCTKGM